MSIDADTVFSSALTFHQAGMLIEAEALYKQILTEQPRHFNALHLLGLIEHKRGNFRGAADLIGCAIDQDPSAYPAHNNLGLVYAALDDFEAAKKCFEQALNISPHFGEALRNLGSTLVDLERPGEALVHFQEALAINPELPQTHFCLGKAYETLGSPAEALACYQEALMLKPDFAEAQYCLGVLLQVQGLIDDALECFRAAICAKPDYVEANWALTISQLAVVHDDDDAPEAFRAAFSEALTRLDRWFSEERLKDGYKAVGTQQPFYLAYHQTNNRSLLGQYGDLCARLMRSWQEREGFNCGTGGVGDTVRVGLVSAHVFDQSVWSALIKGWCQHLDRQRFSLFVYYLGSKEDEETAFARAHSTRLVQGARDLRGWVTAILSDRLDVIIYPEIGMDQLTTKLASMRLCAVQAVAWGHPETTGLPTIDYYLSAEDLEPPNAAANYREKLIQLPHLGCCYRPFDVEGIDIDLHLVGVDSTLPILLCPGTPFKYAPQYDWIFVEIARKLGRCQFLFFDHQLGNLSEKLKSRLESVFLRYDLYFDEYAVTIPWLNRPAFYGLLRRADVYLDTIGFSGFNTAMQAIECGLPIVTQDAQFMRGRLASGILRRMNISELIALDGNEYVDLVVKLVNDRVYAESIRNRITTSRQALFHDLVPIRALEEFILEAVGRPV